jgi:hypothetical protein
MPDISAAESLIFGSFTWVSGELGDFFSGIKGLTGHFSFKPK